MSNRKKRRKRPAPPEGAALSSLQAQTYRVATTWHQGIDLQYLGVDLGQCIEYPIIQNVNNAILNTMRGHDG